MDLDRTVEHELGRLGLSRAEIALLLADESSAPAVHRRALERVRAALVLPPPPPAKPVALFSTHSASLVWERGTRPDLPQPVCFTAFDQLIMYPRVYSIPEMTLTHSLGYGATPPRPASHVASAGTRLAVAFEHMGIVVWSWYEPARRWEDARILRLESLFEGRLDFSPSGARLCAWDPHGMDGQLVGPSNQLEVALRGLQSPVFLSDVVVVCREPMRFALCVVVVGQEDGRPTPVWPDLEVVEFAPLHDGRRLAATTRTGRLVCGAPLEEGERVSVSAQVTGLIASPVYVAGRVDDRVHVWETQRLALVRVIDMMYVSALHLHPQGRWLATCRHPNNNYALCTHVDVWSEV